MLSKELASGLDIRKPIRVWDSFDDLPELLKGKVAVLFITDVAADNNEVEGLGRKWDDTGYVLELTDDEIEEIKTC